MGESSGSSAGGGRDDTKAVGKHARRGGKRDRRSGGGMKLTIGNRVAKGIKNWGRGALEVAKEEY